MRKGMKNMLYTGFFLSFIARYEKKMYFCISKMVDFSVHAYLCLIK